MFCIVILKRLISFGFAIYILMFSIGINVVQHNCVWCGGNRIELAGYQKQETAESSCCSKHQSAGHNCKEEGCCKPGILKLTKGVTADHGFDFKRINSKPILIEAVYLLSYLKENIYNSFENYFLEKGCIGSISPPGSFRVPLRC